MFVKSQIAAGWGLPQIGAALISVNDYDKSAGLKVARDLLQMVYKLFATSGTTSFINRVGIPVEAG